MKNVSVHTCVAHLSCTSVAEVGLISMKMCSTRKSSREFVNLPARLRKLSDY